MTPCAFARAECGKLDSDGTCTMIEPTSWHDYRMKLPDLLTQEQWASLVAGARARGELTIKVDITTGGSLDTTQPHANRRRLDMYYCPGCGHRMGSIGTVCPPCSGVEIVPDDVDRRCRVGRGLRSGYFERVILPLADQAGPKIPAKLLLRRAKARTAYLARYPVEAQVERTGPVCDECGLPLPPGRKCGRCGDCARKRNRTTARERKRRERLAVV